jgi:hypothetical protein
MDALIEALHRIARSQHGVIARTQLLDAGVTSTGIHRALDRGLLDRCSAGVFRTVGSPTTHLQRLTAAFLGSPGGVVSHESAAQLHRFPLLPRDLVVLSVPPGGHHDVPLADRVHRSSDLDRVRHVDIGCLQVTSPPRVLMDIAIRIGPGRLERLLDDLLSSGRVDPDELIRVFNRLARRGRPGGGRLRPLLEVRLDGRVLPASTLEAVFLRLVRTYDLPEPQCQHLPPWAIHDGIGRVDFAYPHLRLLVEVDGRRWHSRDAAFDEDRRRDQEAVMAGWRVLRFTWRQVTRAPLEVATAVRTVIRRVA